MGIRKSAFFKRRFSKSKAGKEKEEETNERKDADNIISYYGGEDGRTPKLPTLPNDVITLAKLIVQPVNRFTVFFVFIAFVFYRLGESFGKAGWGPGLFSLLLIVLVAVWSRWFEVEMDGMYKQCNCDVL